MSKTSEILTDEALGPDVEIGTESAARLLGVSRRYMQAMCDEDVFREGVDWWRIKERGHYKIRRRSVMAQKLAHKLGRIKPPSPPG